jgi:hypothetical protein
MTYIHPQVVPRRLVVLLSPDLLQQLPMRYDTPRIDDKAF